MAKARLADSVLCSSPDAGDQHTGKGCGARDAGANGNGMGDAKCAFAGGVVLNQDNSLQWQRLKRIKGNPGRATVDDVMFLFELIEELQDYINDDVQRIRALAASRAGRMPK